MNRNNLEVGKRLLLLYFSLTFAPNRDQAKTKLLPLHPNIVIMPGYFVDQTPYLSGGADAYPAALPSRLHEGGFGRNSTMFLVMKK